MLHLIRRGRSPSYVSIDSSTFRSIFHRFDDENDENYENDENDENHQPVVYSQIDPNGCKSVSIEWEVSYDTLLDAASATMLIVLSLISKNQ